MMKKKGWYGIAIVLAVWSMSCWLFAVPLKINYQGRLTNNNNPVTAIKTMYFSIKNDGGTTVWGPESKSVNVVNGLYNVILEPPQGVFETAQQLVLHIKVDGIDLSPDIQLLAVPYAYKAKGAEQAEAITPNSSAGNSIITALGKATNINIAAEGTDKDISLTPSGAGALYLLGSSGAKITSANGVMSMEY